MMIQQEQVDDDISWGKVDDNESLFEDLLKILRFFCYHFYQVLFFLFFSRCCSFFAVVVTNTSVVLKSEPSKIEQAKK